MSAKHKNKRKTKPKKKPDDNATVTEIQMQSPLWATQPQVEQTVRDAVATAAAVLSTSGGEVGILLTDDSAVRVLNRHWRGIDKPTNVLSFPAPKGPVSGGAAVLGDIVIAYETLHRECEEEGRDFLHHLSHLTVHGFLHLIGYDHQTDAEADEMEGIESKIMTAMDLPDPWQNRDLDREIGSA